MNDARTVVVTGSHGRLGRALVNALGSANVAVLGLARPDIDLDDPATAARVVRTPDLELVIHCAAWTDVDGCARQPDLAQRRNGHAVGELASSCAAAGVRMLLISTNEVFDGQRQDSSGYAETDEVRPINSYGRSKLLGEQLARAAFADAGRAADLAIIRTAWLFGPPGDDFPARIVAAADRLPEGAGLSVVADEIGTPTYAPDLAAVIVQLVTSRGAYGVLHVVNDGRASRAEYAQHVLGRCRPARAVLPISGHEYTRASTPPAWAVLDNRRARALGMVMRPWQQALDDYLDSICPS